MSVTFGPRRTCGRRGDCNRKKLRKVLPCKLGRRGTMLQRRARSWADTANFPTIEDLVSRQPGHPGGPVTKKLKADQERARSAAIAARAARLLEGEDPTTPYPEDATQWIRVYEELLGFKDRMLVRMNDHIRTVSKAAQAELKSQDVEEFEIQRAGYQVRMDFWQRRQLELRGIDLDAETRVLRSNGNRAVLTKRQYQLLTVLLKQPGRHLKAAQLARAAWDSDALSAEQVRSYIVQLRQILAEVGLPYRIVSQPRLGYTLELDGDDEEKSA